MGATESDGSTTTPCSTKRAEGGCYSSAADRKHDTQDELYEDADPRRPHLIRASRLCGRLGQEVAALPAIVEKAWQCQSVGKIRAYSDQNDAQEQRSRGDQSARQG